MGVFGLDPMRLIHSRDQLEFLALQAVSEKMQKYIDIQQHNLAVSIANEVGIMLGLKK